MASKLQDKSKKRNWALFLLTGMLPNLKHWVAIAPLTTREQELIRQCIDNIDSILKNSKESWTILKENIKNE